MKARAFSLVEIMIVLTVMAIAAMLVLPMASNNSQTRLTNAARLLAADLEYAQAQSLVDVDDPYVVVFDLASNQYYIARKSDPATPITNPVDQSPYLTQLGEGRAAGLAGVTLQSVSFNDDYMLGFLRYGQLDQAADATITLADDGNTVTITIDAITGAATIP